jgi:cell division protein ZapA (FtsZ GTPase activity inhibitor)
MNKRKIKQLRNRTLLAIFITIAIIGGLRTFDDLQRNHEILDNKNKQLNDQIAQEIEKKILQAMGVLVEESESSDN